MCYFPLTYNDSLIFVTFCIKMSWRFVFFTNIESVISWYFLTQFLKQSPNFKQIRFQSTTTFADTKLPLPQHREHCNTEHYRGSTYYGKVDLDSDINGLASG